MAGRISSTHVALSRANLKNHLRNRKTISSTNEVHHIINAFDLGIFIQCVTGLNYFSDSSLALLELKSDGLENTRISRPKIKEKTETTKRKNGQEKKENRKEKSKKKLSAKYPQTGVIVPSFAETGDKMRSQDENIKEKQQGTKLVFSPKFGSQGSFKFQPQFFTCALTAMVVFYIKSSLVRKRSCKSSELTPSFMFWCTQFLSVNATNTQHTQNWDETGIRGSNYGPMAG